jgi:uncharacterized protein YjeT (DUF2065 family)
MKRTPLWWIALAIAVITVISGAVQMLAPQFVLKLISADITKTSSHFFAIVGMFMVLFGGALWQALCSDEAQETVFLWAGLQKFGAATAVALGVNKAVFAKVALLVAGFDLVSALLIFACWRANRAPC